MLLFSPNLQFDRDYGAQKCHYAVSEREGEVIPVHGYYLMQCILLNDIRDLTTVKIIPPPPQGSQE